MGDRHKRVVIFLPVLGLPVDSSACGKSGFYQDNDAIVDCAECLELLKTHEVEFGELVPKARKDDDD